MNFKKDTPVYSTDGQVVGQLDRVVLDPKTKAVSHIIIRKGFFIVEDKVIPLDMITSGDTEGIILSARADEVEKLISFEESHYVSLTPDEAASAAFAEGFAEPLYWYPPVGGYMGYDYMPPYGLEVEQNIPEHTVAVMEGAFVVTSDGKEVGHVEQVFTDPVSKRATYFIIKHGLLIKKRKSIPTAWISKMTETEIQLSVGASVVDQLPDYEAAN